MTAIERNCGSCGAAASLVCSGCGEVAYCSKDHQKLAWKKGHKNECKAYKIECHDKYGRYLVASRDLKPGSRILTRQKPSVFGPMLTAPLGPSCVSCNATIKSKPVTCPKCRYTFCSNRGCKHADQDELCLKLSQLECKNNHQLVTPLSFLMLQKSNPDLFSKLLSLESHVSDLKASSRWKDMQAKIVAPLQKLDYDQDLISQVVGIICTNSFELLQPGKGAPQHGLFEMASLMNHDCIGNTR